MTNDELVATVTEHYDHCVNDLELKMTDEQKVMAILNSHHFLRENNMQRSRALYRMSWLKRKMFFWFYKDLWR